ncbi:MAG TPA: hypothetical protein VNN62_27525 [Methylomirabilota bacterium]|nr:hypothetical protein [Methylomirabilota bacterium]
MRSPLYVALDVGYLNQADFDRLFTQTEELGCILSSLHAAVARKERARSETS